MMAQGDDQLEDSSRNGTNYKRNLEGYFEIVPGAYRGTQFYFNGGSPELNSGTGLGRSINNTQMNGVRYRYDIPETTSVYRFGIYQLKRLKPVINVLGNKATMIGNEWDNTFSINLSAESVDGLSGGDFVQMSVKENANDSFRYGEDEFDHPNPAMNSFIDLYFDKSEWLGSTDQNGVMVDNPYFSHDVRSLDLDAQAWNIKGNLYNVSGDIELSWTMDESDQEVHLLILGEVYFPIIKLSQINSNNHKKC